MTVESCSKELHTCVLLISQTVNKLELDALTLKGRNVGSAAACTGSGCRGRFNTGVFAGIGYGGRRGAWVPNTLELKAWNDMRSTAVGMDEVLPLLADLKTLW